MARTILVRLVVALLGYGAICAAFPFLPERLDVLLASVVALGAFSGLAFSASYQLVARFANKSVIALGLGCSASGPIILALQLLFGMGRHPTRGQHVLMYETIAAVVACGLWATVSLLLRHWEAIDASARPQVSPSWVTPAAAVCTREPCWHVAHPVPLTISESASWAGGPRLPIAMPRIESTL